jgi:hypothetical protein
VMRLEPQEKVPNRNDEFKIRAIECLT